MNLLDAFNLPFVQHAFVAVLFAGAAFPLVGVFIVSLDLVPLRFAMMHVALLGGAVGLFLKIDPMLFGLLFCALAASVMGPLSERMKMGLGTISGLFMTLTLALAFVLFYKGQIHVLQAFSILWGNILSLTRWDIIIVAITSLFVVIIVFVFFKEIQAILYDREVALSVGISEKQIYYLIVFILGLTIAVSMRLIGALLVDAFVLLPAIAAHLIARSLKQMFILSSIFGLIAGLGGLHISLAMDIPASSAIIIIAAVVIIICVFLKRKLAPSGKAL